MSGSIISSSVYFLWRITTFPGIGNIDASLIGIAVTCAIFLCAYGIGSGRGNPIESSLLVSLQKSKSTRPPSHTFCKLLHLLIAPANYTVLLCSPLYVPDLHRLQTLNAFGQSDAQQTRIPALPASHHGLILLDRFLAPTLPPVVPEADYELRRDCRRNNHPERCSLVGVQAIRILCGNQDYSCRQR